MSVTKRKQLELNIGQDPNGNGYGDTNSPGISVGDDYEEVVDKLVATLDRLAPPVPTDTLNLTNLNLSGTQYTAVRIADGSPAPASSEGTIVAEPVTADSLPVMVVADDFFDGQNGDLIFTIISTDSTGTQTTEFAGTVDLSQIAPPITSQGITIASQVDPFSGQPGAGFYLLASGVSIGGNIDLSLLTTDANDKIFTYRLEQTDPSVQSIEFSFYVDANITTVPTIVPDATPLSINSSNLVFNSGVPAIGSGSIIGVTGTVNNAVSGFYNPTRLFAASGSSITNTNQNFSSIPSNNSPVAFAAANFSFTVLDDIVEDDLTLSLTPYNAADIAGASVDFSSPTPIRIDSFSDEDSIRVRSGQGTFPAIGGGTADAGNPYNSQSFIGTNAFVSAGFEDELQYVGGIFRLPEGDYTTILPQAGPDYTGLSTVPTELGNTIRWATFQVQLTGADADPTSIRIQLNNTAGTYINGSGSVQTLNFEMYVKVRNETNTTDLTSWIDANNTFIPPFNATDFDAGGIDGVFGLVPTYTNLSNFDREVALGSTRAGNVQIFVRIGIPTNGADKTFGGITVTRNS